MHKQYLNRFMHMCTHTYIVDEHIHACTNIHLYAHTLTVTVHKWVPP